MLLTVCIPATILEKKIIFKTIRIKNELKKKIQFSIFLDGEDIFYDKSFIKRLKKNFNNPLIIFNKTKKNAGVSFARNKLIKSVKTPFLTFVDADDILTINKNLLSRIDQCFKKNYELLILQHESNGERGFDYNMSGEIKGKYIVNLVKKHLKFPKGNSIITHCWSKVFSTDFIKKNKIKFNEKYKVLEDYLFVANVFKNLKKAYISKNVYYYHSKNKINYNYKMALRHLIYSKNYFLPVKIFSQIIKPKKMAHFYFNKACKYWSIKQKKIIEII
jgi:glycosyltransferase involved in cell wall biosynthesis